LFALRETLRRRNQSGRRTFTIFVDFRKAYDTVPREYLFLKMAQYGVPEVLINNVRAYYHISTGQVRRGDHLSEKFKIEMGVKQGCSLSPLLFSIFINDILDDIKSAKLGVEIPGVSETLSGLLYADDLALLLENPRDIKRALRCIDKWCDTWQMRANATKCAIVCFGENFEEATSALQQQSFFIGGNRVPITNSYKYLGCIFHSDLTWTSEVHNRTKSGRGALFASRQVLINRKIKVSIRLNYLKAMFLPVVLYGCEIWYEAKIQLKNLEELYTTGLRWVLGCNKLTPKAALYYETGMKPLLR
jgi:hypothetical protein